MDTKYCEYICHKGCFYQAINEESLPYHDFIEFSSDSMIENETKRKDNESKVEDMEGAGAISSNAVWKSRALKRIAGEKDDKVEGNEKNYTQIDNNTIDELKDVMFSIDDEVVKTVLKDISSLLPQDQLSILSASASASSVATTKKDNEKSEKQGLIDRSVIKLITNQLKSEGDNVLVGVSYLFLVSTFILRPFGQ